MRILSPFPSGYAMILIQMQGANQTGNGTGDLFQTVSYQDPWAQGIDVGFIQVYVDPVAGAELQPGVFELLPNSTETTENGSTLVSAVIVADFPRNKYQGDGAYQN